MAKFRPAELNLTQYENALVLNTLEFLNDMVDQGFESDGILKAIEGLEEFEGVWCSGCDEHEIQLQLVYPVKGWKNQ